MAGVTQGWNEVGVVGGNSAATAQIAKEFAKAHGFAGDRGGWIYNVQNRAVAQGWQSFASLYRIAILNWVTETVIAGEGATMEQFVLAEGHYRPTVMIAGPKDWRRAWWADKYDEQQRRRGDDRRAYRGVKGGLHGSHSEPVMGWPNGDGRRFGAVTIADAALVRAGSARNVAVVFGGDEGPIPYPANRLHLLLG